MMLNKIPDIIIYHMLNDRMNAYVKVWITSRDILHQIVVYSYDRNSQNIGFQASR